LEIGGLGVEGIARRRGDIPDVGGDFDEAAFRIGEIEEDLLGNGAMVGRVGDAAEGGLKAAARDSSKLTMALSDWEEGMGQLPSTCRKNQLRNSGERKGVDAIREAGEGLATGGDEGFEVGDVVGVVCSRRCFVHQSSPTSGLAA